MSAVRVLIAEDSLTVGRRLVEVFSRAAGCQVVGEALDGYRALELCRKLRPDVVVLDMLLSGMGGVETTTRIMSECPTPIVLVSEGGLREAGLRAMDALAVGAVDALDKLAEPGTRWEAALVERVRLASRVRVVTLRRGGPRPKPQGPVAQGAGGTRLVAIGASTGGPVAVREVLKALGPRYPLPVLLVIHLSAQFDAAMAEWLAAQSGLPVRHAVDGEALPVPGRPGVWMAPAGRHLVVRGGRLRLESGPERHSCRPSVDELFESVAREAGASAVGCLLTGMGTDGAQGLGAMRRAGALTVAQDEATSTIFGMPREAILLGAATRVLGLGDIGPFLVDLARSHAERKLA